MSRLIFGKVKYVNAREVTLALPGGKSETSPISRGGHADQFYDPEYRHEVTAFTVTNAGRLRDVDHDATRAVRRLREAFPMDSTVGTLLASVSPSGMSRRISVLGVDESGTVRNYSHDVARVLGRKHSSVVSGAVVESGAGMDMGFHLVYSLAWALYGDGYALSHRWI